MQLLQQVGCQWRSKVRGISTLHTLYWGPNGNLSWPFADADATSPSIAGHPSPATACADFESWCAAHPDSEVRIFVSGHLLHSLVVDPTMQLADDAAVSAYAQQQFGHYHGVAARQWPLAVWSHQNKTQRQSGACALHGVDMSALQNAARGHGVRVRSVSPVWSAGLSSVTSRWSEVALKNSVHAVALIEGSLLTWMLLQSGMVMALEQRYLDAPNWPAALRLVAQLSAESGPLATPAAVVAWGLPARTDATEARHSTQPSSIEAAVGAWPADEGDCRAMRAWVLDAVGSTHMAT